MSNEFDLAVIGMSCYLPGARNLDQFWRNLVDGVESIPRLSEQEILSSGVSASHLSEQNYVKAAPVLDEPGHFDAAFFGFSPTEARNMDPQHRILLELAHEALEHAGYDPDRYPGRIGVFTGSALNTYFTNVQLNRQLAQNYIPILIGNDKDFLSTRISYKLNLKGPSITIQTACSTSIVAVHLARQSLLCGETDMALAGAISVRVPHRAGYFYDGGGVVSPDGHVRAFDAKANGTVFGSGGGILVLKRLADALAAGDTVHAIIKGSAVNNDGAEKAGYTAPSVNSQAEAVVEALANAGLQADQISYIEAHGSGTPVGDPIEISALTKAFRTFTARSGYCAIGSVKSNVGHLDVAAGIAGMIKTILALEHRQIPPSLNFIEPNPEIDFSQTPFYVNTRLREWVSDGPRRAGVMSTGMGGTNAHVVLEEASQQDVSAQVASPQLLILSAKTATALDQATNRLREFLQHNETVNMSDLAYTLQVGRKPFSHRRCLICTDRQDALNTLAQTGAKRIDSARADETRRPLIFLLPGIGDHYVGMGHGLYEHMAIFKDAVDQCAHILEPHMGVDIRRILYPSNGNWQRESQAKGIDLRMMLGRKSEQFADPDTKTLNQTLFAQPALFTIEYAMARLWQSLGIVPEAIIGHSMGEYVAACLAEVLTLEDALSLISTRARLVNDLAPGAMLAVTLPESELLALIPEQLSISLINGPTLCVVAGPADAVADFERVLTARGVICRQVQNTHAFHSRMLDPIVTRFEQEVQKVRLREPKIPYISNVTGTWITAKEATDPAYWAKHANHTARFSDALSLLWRFENPVLVEVGPGRTLGVLATQHPDRQKSSGNPVVVASIRPQYENRSDVEHLLHGIGELWLAGSAIQWDNLPSGAPHRRVALPTYPFERQHYWIETPSDDAKQIQRQIRLPKISEIDNWFYVPKWQPKAYPSEKIRETHEDVLWLIVGDRYGAGAGLTAKINALKLRANLVHFGESFAVRNDGSYEINPAGVEDYVKLFREIKRQWHNPINIIHFGSLTRGDADTTNLLRPADQDFGFYSLLYIAQAIGELNLSLPIKIAIVTNRIHKITGEERLNPAMATVLGPCGVIPKEFSNVQCFNIDLADDQVEAISDETLRAIVNEFKETSPNRAIAYRGRHRWERTYEPAQLPKLDPSSPHSDNEINRLRRGGVYLITGGTGGIGLTVAKYLAQACQPKLVLTKKAPFPEKSQWRKLSAAGDTPEPTRRIIKSLLEIEDLGAEVQVMVAEASDREQMRQVLQQTQKQFNTINGVIHGAGIVRAGLIQAKKKEIVESVFAPKVYGTMLLHELLRDIELDFLVLFSSITSVITPYAEADYSAANCFLDAFARFANAEEKYHTLTINWPGWKEIGQLVDLEIQPGVEAWKQAALEKAIATKDGLEAFKRALHSDLTQVIVSPENLGELLKHSESPFDPTTYLAHGLNGKGSRTTDHSQGNGRGPKTDDVETTVAEAWRNVLGFDQIGVHDNFAQLGGHSLLAMQIVGKIRSSYGIDFSLRDFFEAPTIAQSSLVIKSRLDLPSLPRSKGQPQLLSPMGQRFFCGKRIQQPLFFGPTHCHLFGIYHPPDGGSGRVLTVICPPLFNEYMRTQLALRELAISLSENGQHVLRFDYRGTGDSFGELENVTVSDWLEDIRLAACEGRKLSGSTAVRLIGVRAGALLACRSMGLSSEIERLVLWDPVSDGADYLQSLRRIQMEIIERNLCLGDAERQDMVPEYAGHRLSKRLVEEFGSLDASSYQNVPKGKLHVVNTSPEAGFPVPGVTLDVARLTCAWETELESLMMPKPVLERLTTCLVKG